MRDNYFRTGEGFLLVYSLTMKDSFEQVQQLYEQILRVTEDPDVCACIEAAKQKLKYLILVAPLCAGWKQGRSRVTTTISKRNRSITRTEVEVSIFRDKYTLDRRQSHILARCKNQHE